MPTGPIIPRIQRPTGSLYGSLFLVDIVLRACYNVLQPTKGSEMTKLKVFYNPKQQVEDNKSFSPSAGKPRLVLESWISKRPDLIQVVESKACSLSMMKQAHSSKYVNDLMSLKTVNGFGNKQKSVAMSLPYTTGSFASAAVDAINTNSVNASLTSGFHHACYENGGGFCSMNGLVIAAQLLKNHGDLKKGRVGILDLDQHFGNGTEDIIKKLNLDYIDHWTLGGFQRLYDDKAEDEFRTSDSEGRRVLDQLPRLFAEKFAHCDIVLIQLGADSCKEDPLGHTFTKEEMLERDRLVFSLVKKYNLPAVFNLAGGYQDPIQNVLDLHDFSLQAWAENFTTDLK